jgi:hypothetical protein
MEERTFLLRFNHRSSGIKCNPDRITSANNPYRHFPFPRFALQHIRDIGVIVDKQNLKNRNIFHM